MRSPLVTCSGVVLVLCVAPECRADLLSPTAPVAGVSQAQLSGQWWNWALSFPPGSNPVEDTTGQFAHLGERGSVFFLAGAFTTAPVTRSVTLRDNQTVFFPLINAFSGYRPGDPDFPVGGDAAILQEARNFFGTAGGLFLTLNGAPIPLPAGTTSLNNFYQETLFDLNIPVNNVYGAPPGLYRTASVGHWAALTLPPGTYQLSFGGSTAEFSQNITYLAQVQSTPEPATVATFAVLALGAFGVRRRRRVVA